MNQFRLILILAVLPLSSIGQVKDPSGVYYLEGVMETASGFKLNADSSFEFFFSYGALDRTGGGTWNREGDRLVFRSPGKPSAGFVLSKSEKRTGNRTELVIRDENKALIGFVHARLTSSGAAEFTSCDAQGRISWDATPADSLEIYFELCPERSFMIAPKHKGDNYFECTLSRDILVVYFDGLSLEFDSDKLTGPHPLLRGDDFVYRKETAR